MLRFDLPPTAAVANLTGAATGIRRMVARPPAESTATVIDTADHRLLDWGIELSRIVETGQWVLRAPGWVPPLQAETVSPQAEDELPPELERPYESLGLDPPRAVLTLDKVESTGIAREAIIEFGDPNGDGTVAVRRRDRFEHTVFNVPEADVARVVGADARQFLALTLFPQNVATMSEVTIRAGGKTRTLRRDKNPEAPLWRDVADPNLETGLFQQWISALPGWQPDRILPRDPIAADGFGPDEASVTIKTDDPAVKGGVLHVTFGAKAAGGRHVLAQSDAFPARTVFELPVAVIDEMLKLLQ